MKINKVLCLLAVLSVSGCATDGVVYYDNTPPYYYYTYPRSEVYIWPEWDIRGHREYWDGHHHHRR